MIDLWLGSHGILLESGASFLVGRRKCRLLSRRVLAAGGWLEPAVCDRLQGMLPVFLETTFQTAVTIKLEVGCRRGETFWRARGSFRGGR